MLNRFIRKSTQLALLVVFVIATVATGEALPPPLPLAFFPGNGAVVDVPSNGRLFLRIDGSNERTHVTTVSTDDGVELSKRRVFRELDTSRSYPDRVSWHLVRLDDLDDGETILYARTGRPSSSRAVEAATIVVRKTDQPDDEPPSMPTVFQEPSCERSAYSVVVGGLSDDTVVADISVLRQVDGRLVQDPLAMTLARDGDSVTFDDVFPISIVEPPDELCYGVLVRDIAGNETATDVQCFVPTFEECAAE